LYGGVVLVLSVVAGLLLLVPSADDSDEVEPGAPDRPASMVRSPVPLPGASAPGLQPPAEPVATLWVRADAGPGGDGSEGRPFKTLEEALDVAGPGYVVSVAPGTYHPPENLRSVRSGERHRPIRLVGHDAELRGDGDGRLVEITHDYISLEGFRLRDADILVWVQKATGVRIIGNTLSDAAGECVRLKYFASGNEVAHNRIERCGLGGFNLNKDDKNGEGIYIGTAPEQREEKNPTADVDDSGRNWVHENTIEVPAECVDVKEGSRENLVENNVCTGSKDPDGAGFSSRGLGTVFRNNRSTGHAGAGIRLGGDSAEDGTLSVVVGNVLADNEGYGIKVLREPQAQICGNVVRNNSAGEKKDDDRSDPRAPCG